MAYKLYTDKSELFECEVSVKNASLKNSVARLVVEADGYDLIFRGDINNGKCTVPIKKLKGVLDESTKGNMHLEIIVEDTYFVPLSDDFVVEEHTSMKVVVKEQTNHSTKPMLEVTVKPTSTLNISLPAKELTSLCQQFNINSKNYKSTRRADFKQILKEYFIYNPEYFINSRKYINETVMTLR